MSAAAKGQTCVVRGMLTAREVDKVLALSMACGNGHIATVRLIMENGAQNGDPIDVNAPLNAPLALDRYAKTLLECACHGGHYHVASYLFDCGANRVTTVAVLWATASEKAELVRLLLSHSGMEKGRFALRVLEERRKQKTLHLVPSNVENVLIGAINETGGNLRLAVQGGDFKSVAATLVSDSRVLNSQDDQ
ncbi:MAG: hypothetical protein SGARI_003106, partial [Bacillariaceae sp.]